jgi:NDP-sugar pyrophosphorylase family protein
MHEADVTRFLAMGKAEDFSLDTWPDHTDDQHAAYVHDHWQDHLPTPEDYAQDEEMMKELNEIGAANSTLVRGGA